MIIKSGLATLALLGTVSTAAYAGDRNSMEDQIACTPDVYRLCSQFIPNEDAITSCLQQNLPRLSSACHKVFSPAPAGQQQNNDDE